MTTPAVNPEAACNIGSLGRRRRYVVAVPLILLGVAGSFLSKSFLSQVVGFFGLLSYFQAREGVCVAMAHKSSRNMDDGRGTIHLDDGEDIAYFNDRARAIYVKTFFATLVLILVTRGYHILAG